MVCKIGWAGVGLGGRVHFPSGLRRCGRLGSSVGGRQCDSTAHD